jgi:integrase
VKPTQKFSADYAKLAKFIAHRAMDQILEAIEAQEKRTEDKGSAYCGVLPRQMVGAHQAAGLAQNFRALFINRSREHQASPWADSFGEITADSSERCLSCALARLAPRSVHHMHRVLSQALKQAVRWRLLLRNPCDDCDPPKLEPREMKVWDVATMVNALELARPWRVHIPLCGLRRGEIAALRWRHVDLDRAQLAVIDSAEQTRNGVRYKRPKNGKGRTVALPAIAVEELRAHRLRQAEELLRVGVRVIVDTFVCEKMASRNSRTQLATRGIGLWRRSIYHASDSTTFGTVTPRPCLPATFIRR